MPVLRSVLALLVALALGFGSAPSAVAAEPATITTTLSGQVVGYAGLSNIDLYHWDGTSFVAVPGRDDQTAADGAFSIVADLVTGDIYTVRASVTGSRIYYGGYGDKPTTASAGFVAGAGTINLGTFSLGTTYTLGGTVLDETGAGFGGATVKVFAASADPATAKPLYVGESTTGDLSSGDYGFQLPAGSYRVVASAPGYQPASETVSITLAAVTVPDLALSLGESSITGVVLLPAGAAAAGATVQAFRWADDDWTLEDTATAAADGGYRLSVPTKSKVMLFAKAAGYVGRWSGGVSELPSDSSSPAVLTAADGLVVASLELSTSFGAVAGQALDYCARHTLASGDSYNEVKASLGFSASLYGPARQSAFVTDRGFIYLADSSQRAAFAGSEPSALDSWTGVPLIAPLWFDGDITGDTPGSVTYGSSDDSQSFCVRWNNLGHYSKREDSPNTFQLILRSKAGAAGRSSGDVDITFNYDRVLWDGSSSRAVGYTAGDATEGHYWVYDGSSNPGVITDSGSSPLVTHSVGSDVLGRYVLSIKNPPVNLSAPTISVVGGGPVAPRATLSAAGGSWSPAPSAFTYQWLLDRSPVAGATGKTWVVPDNSEGKKISVVVTSDVDVPDVAATSSEVTVGGLATSAVPTITGTPVVGKTLEVNVGSWAPTADRYTYQWSLDGVPKSAAARYVVPAKSETKSVSVTVTAYKAGYHDVTASAAAVKVLRVFSKQPTPKISGTVKVGKTLTAKPGTWSPKPGLSYQWFRSGVAISGATASKYKVKLADVGAKLTVRVAAAKAGYLGVTKTSKATKTVPKVPLKTSTPKLSGTTRVGFTLTAKPGSWTSGATLRFAWYRSGKLITGATASTYQLQAADRGKTIKVKVTGSKTSYTTVSKTSTSTKKIR